MVPTRAHSSSPRFWDHRLIREVATVGAPILWSNIPNLAIGSILYYTILYYTILYYTILYYTIPYYTILYYTILYYTILYYTILYYTILYYTILYYTILYYTILYCTILYYKHPLDHHTSKTPQNDLGDPLIRFNPP